MNVHNDPPRFRLTGKDLGKSAPKSITLPTEGGKFAPDGNVLPFPGNTILCHVGAGTPAHDALIRLQAAAKAKSWAKYFTFLPPSSFHMTVFEGVCMSRGFRSAWPAGIDQELGRDEVSQQMLARLEGLDLPEQHKVHAIGIRHNAGLGLHVAGVTPEDDASLRTCREKLSHALRLNPPGFADYQFHITLAYLLHWVDEPLAQEIGEDVLALLTDFRKEVPFIELGAIEFCDFEDMHAFHPRRFLTR